MSGPDTQIRRAWALAPACLFLTALALANPVLTRANGIGDLYAAASGGVLELHVASGRVVERVDVSPAPSGIAFSNDARSLYLANGSGQISRIDIATIQLAGSITVPIDVVALAIPRGRTAVAAGPGRTRVLLADLDDGRIRQTDRLPGAPNLLAADRRDPHAMAARSGSSWVAIVDVETGAVSKLDVGGAIVGLAVDRAGGAGFVVTRSPDRLTRIRLDDPAVLWKVPLPGQPTAVASTSFGPIVSGSDALWISDGLTAAVWTNQGAPTGILVTSDDGDFVHVGQPDRILTYDEAADLRQTISLPAADRLRGLAAFPARGSLSASTGSSDHGRAVRPPETSTLPTLLRGWTPGPVPLAGAMAIFAILMAAGLIVLRRHAPHD
jgi:DNA-binding beta-propeller fold protein YncE